MQNAELKNIRLGSGNVITGSTPVSSNLFTLSGVGKGGAWPTLTGVYNGKEINWVLEDEFPIKYDGIRSLFGLDGDGAVRFYLNNGEYQYGLMDLYGAELGYNELQGEVNGQYTMDITTTPGTTVSNLYFFKYNTELQ